MTLTFDLFWKKKNYCIERQKKTPQGNYWISHRSYNFLNRNSSYKKNENVLTSGESKDP